MFFFFFLINSFGVLKQIVDKFKLGCWDLDLVIHGRGGGLVHGWDSIENFEFYSLLGLSALKNLKCYPTVTKGWGGGWGRRRRRLDLDLDLVIGSFLFFPF